MTEPPLACSQCSASLPEELLSAGPNLTCPVCQASLEVVVFPARFRPLPPAALPESILGDGEASCFYHSKKRAAVSCQGCGRFLCALCDVEFNHEHVCPTCLQARRVKDQVPELVTSRTLYDGAALLLTLATSVLFCLWFLWIVSAPMAIFFAVLAWVKPGSILPRTRIRSILAIILALLQLAGFFLIMRMVLHANTQV